VVSAFASYYMQQYGVYLDPSMLRNVLRTDWHEAGELLGLSLACTCCCTPCCRCWCCGGCGSSPGPGSGPCWCAWACCWRPLAVLVATICWHVPAASRR
jgi:hypothetical protein